MVTVQRDLKTNNKTTQFIGFELLIAFKEAVSCLKALTESVGSTVVDDAEVVGMKRRITQFHEEEKARKKRRKEKDREENERHESADCALTESSSEETPASNSEELSEELTGLRV